MGALEFFQSILGFVKSGISFVFSDFLSLWPLKIAFSAVVGVGLHSIVLRFFRGAK